MTYSGAERLLANAMVDLERNLGRRLKQFERATIIRLHLAENDGRWFWQHTAVDAAAYMRRLLAMPNT